MTTISGNKILRSIEINNLIVSMKRTTIYALPGGDYTFFYENIIEKKLSVKRYSPTQPNDYYAVEVFRINKNIFFF